MNFKGIIIKKVFYYCSNYIRNKECSKHYISYEEVEKSVIEILNYRIDIICNLDEIIKEQVTFSNIEYTEELNKTKLIEIDKDIKNILF